MLRAILVLLDAIASSVQASGEGSLVLLSKRLLLLLLDLSLRLLLLLSLSSGTRRAQDPTTCRTHSRSFARISRNRTHGCTDSRATRCASSAPS